MKPHPRIRKTVKWGGAAITLLLLAAWIGSGWLAVAWSGSSGQLVGIGRGRFFLLLTNDLPPQTPRWRWGRPGPNEPLLWGFACTTSPFGMECRVPLWAIATPLALITAAAWRLDTLARRRAALNLCPTCRYDRTGLAPSSVCPECGRSQPSAV